MNFIKKNYEKILLGAVLLGLVVSLLLGQFLVAQEKQALEDQKSRIIQTPPKPLPALDMSGETNILNREGVPYALDFETTNRLFNSMPWKRAVDGRIIKMENGSEARALKVTNITPLFFYLRFESLEPASQLGPARYQLSTEHQGAANVMQRRPRKHFLSTAEPKDETLQLVSVTGPANNPQLTIKIFESDETVTVTMNKSYQEVESYEADLTYPPTGKKWSAQRVGASLKIYDNNYNIVVIDQNEVVISAESNQKRTTVPYQP